MRTPFLSIPLYAEIDTAAFGAKLAPYLRGGDIVRFEGDLGAGKTTLARGLIQALCGHNEDVPSPTFSMVQQYEPAKAPPIWHFDFYRLEKPADVQELGIDEALDTGISLIEWPQKAGNFIPDESIELEFATDRRNPRGDEKRPGRVLHMYVPTEIFEERFEDLKEYYFAYRLKKDHDAR